MHASHGPVLGQVAACAVHRSGALLLEPHDGDALDERLQHCDAAPAAGAPHVPGGLPYPVGLRGCSGRGTPAAGTPAGAAAAHPGHTVGFAVTRVTTAAFLSGQWPLHLQKCRSLLCQGICQGTAACSHPLATGGADAGVGGAADGAQACGSAREDGTAAAACAWDDGGGDDGGFGGDDGGWDDGGGARIRPGGGRRATRASHVCWLSASPGVTAPLQERCSRGVARGAGSSPHDPALPTRAAHAAPFAACRTICLANCSPEAFSLSPTHLRRAQGTLRTLIIQGWTPAGARARAPP